MWRTLSIFTFVVFASAAQAAPAAGPADLQSMAMGLALDEQCHVLSKAEAHLLRNNVAVLEAQLASTNTVEWAHAIVTSGEDFAAAMTCGENANRASRAAFEKALVLRNSAIVASAQKGDRARTPNGSVVYRSTDGQAVADTAAQPQAAASGDVPPKTSLNVAFVTPAAITAKDEPATEVVVEVAPVAPLAPVAVPMPITPAAAQPAVTPAVASLPVVEQTGSLTVVEPPRKAPLATAAPVKPALRKVKLRRAVASAPATRKAAPTATPGKRRDFFEQMVAYGRAKKAASKL